MVAWVFIQMMPCLLQVLLQPPQLHKLPLLQTPIGELPLLYMELIIMYVFKD
jgi:hypothetical protein